ncbi:BlaI/MecI/CopY family transcriptional regulator [Winogradskyella sp.]|uniref:BlaI/MecI/CopY family transcriptional regulator n=1 Tax=Winogradskyella sp. TaxID=1883156 RepID=UPI002602240E|nr:BlaI/MecI/CopY family transcriptional regulator [Winogradskyella sp.]
MKIDTLQLEVMQIIWENPDITVTEIQSIFKKRNRHLAITTIGTILRRLESKGAVTHKSLGKKYIYSALIDELKVKRSMLSKITDQFYKGKSFDIVNHLIDEDMLTSEEIDLLQKKIIMLKKQGKWK